MIENLYKLRWEKLRELINESLDEIGKARKVEPNVYLEIKEILLQVLNKWINKIEIETNEQESRIVDSRYIFDTYEVTRAKVFYDRKVGNLPLFGGEDRKSYRYRQTDVDEWAKQNKLKKVV